MQQNVQVPYHQYFNFQSGKYISALMNNIDDMVRIFFNILIYTQLAFEMKDFYTSQLISAKKI